MFNSATTKNVQVYYVPGTPLSSIFVVEPSKTRSFPIKTKVIWVPGTYIRGKENDKYGCSRLVFNPFFFDPSIVLRWLCQEYQGAEETNTGQNPPSAKQLRKSVRDLVD